MLFRHYRDAIDLVLDVGGRFGDWGLIARNSGYQGQIISFEPVEASYCVLAQRAAQDGRWTAHRCAVGAAEGSAVMNVTRHPSLASLRTMGKSGREAFGEQAEVLETQAAPMRRLDALIADMTPRGIFLKTDTQGWDLEVLKGAEGILDRVVAIQMEMALRPLYEDAPTIEESIAATHRAGFVPSALFNVAWVGDGALDPLAEIDCFMVRGEAT